MEFLSLVSTQTLPGWADVWQPALRVLSRLHIPWSSTLKIVILGAGVQGTVFAVRLALAGHHVTLVSRAAESYETSSSGATVQEAETSRIYTKLLPVLESLPRDFSADFCLVTVRREQIEAVLPGLVEAVAIRRIVFLGNHAYGSDNLLAIPGRSRTVLAFPGIAGYKDGDMIRYVDIPQQHTAVEERAQDVASLSEEPAFVWIKCGRNMDGWLKRHAVFITAIAGALYESECDTHLLAQNSQAVRRLIVGVREGWAAQDRKGVGAAPLALRTIMCWVPLRLSAMYWSRLLASPRGDLYFARHEQHLLLRWLPLAHSVRGSLRENEAPNLRRLLASIDAWQRSFSSSNSGARA